MTHTQASVEYRDALIKLAKSILGHHNPNIAQEIVKTSFKHLQIKWADICRDGQPSDIESFLFLKTRGLCEDWLRSQTKGSFDACASIAPGFPLSPLQAFAARLSQLYNGRNITNLKEPELREFIGGLKEDLEDCAKSRLTETNTLVQMLAEQTALSTKLQGEAGFREICIKNLENELKRMHESLEGMREVAFERSGAPEINRNNEKVIERQAQQITSLKASLQTSHDQIVHLLKEKYNAGTDQAK